MDDMELLKKIAQCEDKEQMQRVIEAHNASQKPQTNADRIRAMSDEELAVMLAKEIPHGDCWGCHLECGVCDGDKFDNGCMNGFYKWLQQPAEA